MTGGGISWLQRFWRKAASAPAPAGGERRALPVGPAVAALESQLCEGFVEREGIGVSSAAARRMGLPGPTGHNVFGRPIQIERAGSAREAVAIASGMTLAGLRSTTFLAGHELGALHEALQGCAERLLPLVLHADLGDAGHSGYHAAAGAGGFQLMASSGQEAIDLCLLARWLAERSLCPGLLAGDGAGVESVVLPDAETIRTFLGAPDAALTCPDNAQRILFGAERPRLLAWFDLDRPVATGGLRSLDDEVRAASGRHAFFQSSLAELARQGMAELGRLTGRPLSFVGQHGMADAELVWLAQGPVAQAARAAADELRRAGTARVGVLTLHWLRPFPAREIAQALGQRRPLAVIEALAGGGEAPLLREVTAAVGRGEGWVSAICGGAGPAPGALAGLCELMQRGDGPDRVDLERTAATVTSDFPRREALLQSVAHAHPELTESALPAARSGGADAAGVRSFGLVGREAELPADALERLLEAAGSELGDWLRGATTRPEPGCSAILLRTAEEDFADPGRRTPVSLLLVADPARALGDPLALVAEGGLVLLAGDATPDRVWSGLPARWRRRVRERELRLVVTGGDLESAIQALGSALRDGIDALVTEGGASEIHWREISSDDEPDRALPAAVERIEHTRPAHDSLPRFWGEVEQPRQGGEIGSLPDPLSASGAVPAGASALASATACGWLPRLDASACTGCGRCWSACPDSAIAVTALPLEALLTAASHQAGCEGPAADAVRRAHKNLAGRLAGQLRKSDAGEFDPALARDAWQWLIARLAPSDEERVDYDASFEATLGVLEQLAPVVSDALFRQPEAAQKGDGALLMLSLDPRTCLGCGLCTAVCPEQALPLEPCDDEHRRRAAARWCAGEALPDTPGAVIARASEHPDVGALAALLLSRHCAQAQTAGGVGEAGSGERLASRLLSALVEERGQRRASELLRELGELREDLDRSARERLTAGLSEADLDTLGQALSGASRGQSDLGQLAQRLDALGSRAQIDRPAVLRMTHAAAELDDWASRLARGQDGLGRARFGVLVARGGLDDWAARYPQHPFYAPLTLAPGDEGVELARGLALGVVAQHLALVRSLRLAKLEREQPPDRAQQLARIQSLTWRDLEPAERQSCPPLLLLGDDHALLDSGFESMTRLLDSDLPVLLVLLDGGGRLDRSVDPALLAMAHQRAFVLSTSIAHPDHLARGLADALAFSGPALVHIHAPSPGRHGFATDATLERARLAVEARAHVLLRYDPCGEGFFGLRAGLEGNPAERDDWGEIDYVRWAAGEQRFSDHLTPCADAANGLPLDEWLALPESGRHGRLPLVQLGDQQAIVSTELAGAAAARLASWRTLQELTGVRSPFTEQIREAVRAELEAEKQTAIEALQAEQAAELAGVRAAAESDALDRLTRRLLELSGFSAAGQSSGGNGTP